MKNLFKWIAVLNIIAFMFVACAPAPTPLPTAATTPTNTPAPTATATPTEIVINDLSSSLCMYDSVTATEYKNSAAVYNPPSQWTLDEQKNIVDAFGIPIYQDVLNIVNGVTQTSGSKLFAAEVAVGSPDLGGYVVAFKDALGNYIYPHVKGSQEPAGRLDGNGVAESWDIVPAPKYGILKPWLERAVGGDPNDVRVCNYFAEVITLPDGRILVAGKYNPIYKTIAYNEATLAEIPGSAEWWNKTLAENRQYEAGGLGLGTKTAEKLKFNPKADQVAIHDQIIASMARQLQLPENAPVWDKIEAEHPEWLGMTNSFSFTFEQRLSAVKEFLLRAGGNMFVKSWSSQKTDLVDFNKSVNFECDEVAKVPSVDGIRINTNSAYGGDYTLAYGTTVNSDGSLIYRTEITNRGGEMIKDIWPRDFYCTYMSLILTEWQARNMEGWSFFTDRQPTFVDFHKFALDLRDPAMLINQDNWSEGFLKSK